MFCPRCGKESGGLCTDCYLELHPVKVNEFKVTACSCGRYLHKGNWVRMEGMIDDSVGRNLLIPDEITLQGVEIRHYIGEGRVNLEIEIVARYKEKVIEMKLKPEVRVEKQQCIVCSRQASGYYEAILQVRVENHEGVLDNLNPDFISKVERVRGGADIYLTSFRYAKQLGREFMNKGFSVKETRKQAGMRSGKSIYRTYLSVKNNLQKG